MYKYLYVILGLLIPCNLASKDMPPVEYQEPYLTFNSLNIIIRELQVIHGDNRDELLRKIRLVLARDYVRHLHDHQFDDVSLANHYINVLGQAPNASVLFLLLVGFLQAAANSQFFTPEEQDRMDADMDDLVMEANARRA